MKKNLLIFLLFVSVVFIFLSVYFIFFYKKDYRELCLKLDNSIKEFFLINNVKNIKRQYSKEYSQDNIKWIQKYYEIILPKDTNLEKFQNDIEKFIIKNKYELIKKKQKNIIEYCIGKNKKVFLNLIFYIQFKGYIAIVIDDLGYENKRIDEFINLGIPITFAILPREKYSKELAQKLLNLKYPYLLHLPLESSSYPKDNPGRYAIFVNTHDEDVEKIFLTNLRSVLKPVGVNNHMGSKFTGDKHKMQILLNLIKKENLFFMDSMTNPKSVGENIAREINLKFLKNNVFLDIVDTTENIKLRFKILLKIVNKYGYGITIGHIHKKHIIEVLKEIIPTLKEDGYKFIFVSDLIDLKYNNMLF